MKPILTAIITGFLLFSTTKNFAQVNVQDSLALVDLYDSTNGPNWVNNNNWLTSAPLYDWYGINVSATTHRVIGVNLYQNNLIGNIPQSFGMLYDLSYLDLRYNH